MSRTIRHEYNKCLFSNGQRGHHNTLIKEFHGRSLMGGIWLVKDSRNMLDRRDYRSDRYKRIRKAANKKRRLYMKKFANEIIYESLN